jgi:hypothetical protein
MPRYFLNIRNCYSFVRDEEGYELPGVDEVHRAAVHGALSLLSHEVAEGKLDLRGAIEVTDEEGDLVLIVPFRDALKIVDDEGGNARGRRMEQRS